MTPPIAKEPELTGLSAVREKLERIKTIATHSYRSGLVAKLVSEALALMESDWREACFDDACEGCCTALENRLRFVERDHEAMEKLRGMFCTLTSTADGTWIFRENLGFGTPYEHVIRTDPTDAILGTESGEDDG